VKPARFSYEAPATLDAALAALAARPDEAKIIAGGQSLAPMINMRLAQPAHLVDINGIAELAGIRLDGDRLVVGALTRHAALAGDALVEAHCPILAHAASTIGHYAIRQRGTVGGSLAHADPAAQLPLIAVLLDAEMEVASATGRRTVPAQDFFLSIFTTALAADELLVAVRFPCLAPGTGWGFRLFNRRAGDFAFALVAASLTRQSPALRLAAGGIAAVPVRLDSFAPSTPPHETGWAARTATAVARAADIEENERVPKEYRRELLAVLAEDALNDALGSSR
jgi:carbon-monoxide dehydrogenase medium subunit